MQRFKSPGQARRFLSAHATIYGHFRPRRHLMTADRYRCVRAKAFQVWQQETCTKSQHEVADASSDAHTRPPTNNVTMPVGSRGVTLGSATIGTNDGGALSSISRR